MHIKNARISDTTIVAPTGVPATMEMQIPRKAQSAERIDAKITTDLNVVNSLMADTAGKITRAVMSKEPTKRMAKTITIAVTEAIKKLYSLVRIPEALAKSSSKVIAKILLKHRRYNKMTTIERITHDKTSELVNVRNFVDPNKVEHTSPAMLDEVENTLRNK